MAAGIRYCSIEHILDSAAREGCALYIWTECKVGSESSMWMSGWRTAELQEQVVQIC